MQRSNIIGASDASANQQQPMQKMRKLRKKIQKLLRKRSKEIQKLKKESLKKDIALNKQAQLIIEGINKVSTYITIYDGEIEIQDGKKLQQQTTKPSANQIRTIPIQSQGIPRYWKKVLLAQYENSMNKTDLVILENLTAIEIQEYSEDKITIAFTFKAFHPLLPQGVYKRTISRDADGNPTLYEGSKLPTHSKLKKGFLKILFTARTEQNLSFFNEFFELLSTELIPRSLQYYVKYRKIQQDKQQKTQAQQAENPESYPTHY